jgi:hypothetical protein
MKKLIFFLSALILIISCQEDELDIPRDQNGNAVLTGVSSATTTGISTLDDGFSVTAHLPNAKSGDVMNVECLQLQYYDAGGNDQLLPLSGTQKTVTVGSDLMATVTYARNETNLSSPGDYVTVSFAGETDYALQRVDMVTASSTTKPKVGDIEIDVMRSNETAYFNVTVEPKSGPYTGTLVAKRKNGVNAAWENVPGSPFSGDQPFLVPISGTDFAADKDTMYYTFEATQSGYTDEIATSIIVRDPYFFLKKSATLNLGAGRNLLINAEVHEDDENAMLALSDELMLKGGSTWLSSENTIEFVPTTAAIYAANNSNDAIAAFEAGTPAATADPIEGEGIFIFKAVTGPNPEDVYYGMIYITSVVPNSSVTFEYRIGNMYAHLAVIN